MNDENKLGGSPLDDIEYSAPPKMKDRRESQLLYLTR